MDNNNSGIPNVSDIKFDDTPAESFDSLYGGSNQQPGNVSMDQVPNMAPNSGMAPSMNQVPNMVPNPGMTQNMSQAPNSGTIIQPSVEDLSDVEIDAERMQSIEEQLSKTSQYNPADFQQEKIVIQTDDQYEKNKSGLTFLIVLFAILILVVILLPQITKFIK